MNLFIALLIAIAAALAVSSAPIPGTTHSIPVSKDTSLCLDTNCYSAVYGTSATIHSANDANDVAQVLLGFALPSTVANNADSIDKCTLTMPAFNTPRHDPVKIWAIRSEGAWDEDTAAGSLQPQKVGSEMFATVDSNEEFSLDITYMCKDAAKDGTDLSLYVASLDIPYTAKSREAGQPSMLQITTH
ncbi:hypothetical protein DL89DRAFT_269478 [Linderina pennispora]|uniref:Carbohydrate-binding module family 96 domain-containing protein n=1 Tax=Linderina pennispora TaxID=61395 RepID=A0A1Y1W0K5_9FUNG|nr:uncharacterized protein DL89DRAFT_269478 [Linderina pennispora]ORX67033.1 hypothetical protein DL89DRAFT_269478 [Linderina pennispora]